jgi:murein DD-endopeptidase MepM/ murein hydrolase activator NlpD
MLTKRIAYLEDYVTNLQDENAKIISLVQRRTQGKIKELTNIIEFTGLKVDKVADIARENLEKEAQQLANEHAANYAEGQGGPLIPDDLTSFGEAFFSDIDEMMLLYSIVDRLPVAEPMKNARRTSTYGRRIDPFTKRWAMHSGMDFAGSYYAPIFATGEGTVIRAGRWGAYGRTVIIDHGYGITTRYGHMKDINVKKGQKVSPGQQIGRQGSSGRSTGQHLHYEVRFNGKALDPEKFLEASSYVKKQQPQG